MKIDWLDACGMALRTRAFRVVKFGVLAYWGPSRGQKVGKLTNSKKYFHLKSKAITAFRILSTCVV